MKKLIVLVGNIGAGKSTICKKYAKQGYIILSRDALRYMVGGGKYLFCTTIEPIIKRAFLQMLSTFMEEGVNIVVDETNVTVNTREKYIQLAKMHSYKVTAVVLPRLSKRVSVNRRMRHPHDTNDRSVWESVWEMFNEMYVTPSYKEGFDKIIKL